MLASLSIIPPVALITIVSCVLVVVYWRRYQRKRETKRIIEELTKIQNLSNDRYRKMKNVTHYVRCFTCCFPN